MKLYVGVTDNDWFDFLTRLPNVDEVNFWPLRRTGSKDGRMGSKDGVKSLFLT
jgi:hypothetical protein